MAALSDIKKIYNSLSIKGRVQLVQQQIEILLILAKLSHCKGS